MSFPIVTPADLGTYLGVTVDDDRATALLGYAQALCESIVSPLPDGAGAVVLDVASRAYVNPSNAQSETTGPYSVSRGPVSGGLWLTRQNISTLRRLGGNGGVFTIDMLPAGYVPPPSWGSYAFGGDWDQPA